MSFAKPSRLVALATFASLGSTQLANAETASRDQCLKSHVAGQERRLEGKLLDARRELLTCSRAECPEVVTRQCVPWLAELEQRIPTIVVVLTDPSGRELSGADVWLDGKRAPDALSGRALALDPGEHEIAVEGEGLARTVKKLVVREGEKARRLSIVVARAHEAAPAAESPSSGPPVMAYVFGAVGVLALSGAGYLFFTARSDAQDLRERCAPTCDESEVGDVRTRLRFATAAGALGLVSLGVGAYFAFGTSASGSASSVSLSGSF